MNIVVHTLGRFQVANEQGSINDKNIRSDMLKKLPMYLRIISLVLGNIDIGSIAFVNNLEVTHKIYKIIGIALVFETFDFQNP